MSYGQGITVKDIREDFMDEKKNIAKEINDEIYKNALTNVLKTKYENKKENDEVESSRGWYTMGKGEFKKALDKEIERLSTKKGGYHLYKRLGLKKRSSIKSIKRRFKKIKKAYKTLSNPKTRKKYHLKYKRRKSKRRKSKRSKSKRRKSNKRKKY
tara:strand:- start:103 stop:570 length:468 start_codon:yes stop_codon:yes gene_type:complete